MENVLSQLLPLALWTKKVNGRKFEEGKGRIRHGIEGWAEFAGVPGRSLLYFNAYMPKSTPWANRWVSLEELHKTPKPYYVDEGSHVGVWLKRLVVSGRAIIIKPTPKPAEAKDDVKPQKTEGQGRHPDHRRAPPIGHKVYA